MGMLPFSMPHAFLRDSQGGLRNPGYPDLPSHLPASPMPVNPDAYYGIASFLDLRMRGGLSDALLMRVKSTEPAYWRGVAFDLFAGQRLGAVDATTAPSSTPGRPTTSPPSTRRPRPSGGRASPSRPSTSRGNCRMSSTGPIGHAPSTSLPPASNRTASWACAPPTCWTRAWSTASSPNCPCLRESPARPPRRRRRKADWRLPATPGGLRAGAGLVDEVAAGAGRHTKRPWRCRRYLRDKYRYYLVPPAQRPRPDSGRLLPLRVGGGHLRTFRQRPGGDVPGRRHPLAAGDGLRHRRLQSLYGAVRGQGQRRPRLGGALLPGCRLVPFRGHPGFLSAREGSGSPFYSMLETLEWLGQHLAGLVPPWLRDGLAMPPGRWEGFFAGLATFGYDNLPGGVMMLLASAAGPLTLPSCCGVAGGGPGARGLGRNPPGSGGRPSSLLSRPARAGGDDSATPRPLRASTSAGFRAISRRGRAREAGRVPYRARYREREITSTRPWTSGRACGTWGAAARPRRLALRRPFFLHRQFHLLLDGLGHVERAA